VLANARTFPKNRRVKIGVITSGGTVARWQADALRQVADGNQFVIYDCAPSGGRRRPVAHGAYYLLNMLKSVTG
jgi:hypothetical protein